MTDSVAPTPEQLAKGKWSHPKHTQKASQAAFRRESVLERLKVNDQLKAAGMRLLECKEGAEGRDVRWMETPRGYGIPGDEFRIHVYGRKYAEAKKAIASPLTWNGLLLLIGDKHELPEIGQLLGKYKDRASAAAWAHGLLSGGLSGLALHFGIIQKPPD